MTTLHSFSDGKFTSYANLRMDNGDAIFISVATSGVMVKKSKLGIFGPKLFVSRDVYHAAMVAKALHEKIDLNLVSSKHEIENVVLLSFVNAGLSCSTTSEFTAMINEAVV